MTDEFGLPLEDEMSDFTADERARIMAAAQGRVDVARYMAGYCRGVRFEGHMARLRGERRPKAWAAKFLYALLNRCGIIMNTRTCRREGYNCEWIYPYGFVPEAGCPWHD